MEEKPFRMEVPGGPSGSSIKHHCQLRWSGSIGKFLLGQSSRKYWSRFPRSRCLTWVGLQAQGKWTRLH